MSLATWKEAFYPVVASLVPKSDAAQHSLTKWQGVYSKNLAAHRVHLANPWVIDDASLAGLPLNSITCALCVHFYQDSEPATCASCPLCIVRGGVSCAAKRKGEAFSPWHRAVELRNIQPIVHWLRKAVAYQKAHPDA